jgi:hypothetical protein
MTNYDPRRRGLFDFLRFDQKFLEKNLRGNIIEGQNSAPSCAWVAELVDARDLKSLGA